MKRIVGIVLALILVFSLLSGCATENLPTIEFPLDLETLDEVIQSGGMFYNAIEVKNFHNPNNPLFGLYEFEDIEENIVVCGLNCYEMNDERYVYMSFGSFYSKRAVAFEDCKEFVALATRLYGGFKNDEVVYDKFISELEIKNTEIIEFENARSYQIRRRLIWEKKIGDIYCKVTFGQPKIDEPQRYIETIALSSDPSIFIERDRPK